MKITGRTVDLFYLIIIGRYDKGEIINIPGFKERFARLADAYHYSVFYSALPEISCLIHIHQEKAAANPDRVMIVSITIEEKYTMLMEREIDEILKEIGDIQEVDVSQEELQELISRAGMLMAGHLEILPAKIV